MRKIPTLYVRGDGGKIQPDVITPGVEWVFQGLGRPTRKYDGTACLLDEKGWWGRRMVREGAVAPEGFYPVYTTPTSPSKTFGWVPIEQTSSYKFFKEAFEETHSHEAFGYGTYELMGPKINGNPEGLSFHALKSHEFAETIDLSGCALTYEDLREFFLTELAPKNIEGIVWHSIGTTPQMAKLKVSDFVE